MMIARHGWLDMGNLSAICHGWCAASSHFMMPALTALLRADPKLQSMSTLSSAIMGNVALVHSSLKTKDAVQVLCSFEMSDLQDVLVQE